MKKLRRLTNRDLVDGVSLEVKIKEIVLVLDLEK